jgi:hypothetical protein
LSIFLWRLNCGGGEKLKKKIMSVFVSLLVIALLATPVLAKPTKGQKVMVSITWEIIGPIYLSDWKETGNVLHRDVILEWDVTLVIGGGAPIFGTAITERKLLRVTQGDGELRILNDYNVLMFTGGTFEGNALLQSHWLPGGPANVQSRVNHALLQGTGDFDGQTISAKHDWRTHDQPIVWSGYLLKP